MTCALIAHELNNFQSSHFVQLFNFKEDLPIVDVPTEKEYYRRKLTKECKTLKDDRTQEINRLKTIPGVGDKTALAFAAYVGDGKRFNNRDEVANYLGLVPRVDCSGSINRYGHITKKGNRIVRALLYQAAQVDSTE